MKIIATFLIDGMPNKKRSENVYTKTFENMTAHEAIKIIDKMPDADCLLSIVTTSAGWCNGKLVGWNNGK